MTVVATDNVSRPAAAATLGERHWRVAVIALLSVRVIQGFIERSLGRRREWADRRGQDARQSVSRR
jgi:hypothetical protein